MWNLLIVFHWPHDRLALGWEYIGPDETHEYSTLKLYLLIMTLELDINL
tara:strand:+ start:105 stop:251 length:147 start_codon:yes stop_codon:yes gene_type:complete